MLKSRWLTSERDLIDFRQNFEERSGNPLSTDYMLAAKVRGFFDQRGELIAGFIINATQPLRYFDWLSEGDREWRHGDAFRAEDFVEITCIWTKKGRIAAISLSRAQIYLESLIFALNTGKPAILGGTFIEKVRDQQMRVMHQPYRAVVTNLRGKECPYWLYYVPRHQALSLMVQNIALEALVFPTQRLTRHFAALLRNSLARSN
jgi:hypothetical protein